MRSVAAERWRRGCAAAAGRHQGAPALAGSQSSRRQMPPSLASWSEADVDGPAAARSSWSGDAGRHRRCGGVGASGGVTDGDAGPPPGCSPSPARDRACVRSDLRASTAGVARIPAARLRPFGRGAPADLGVPRKRRRRTSGPEFLSSGRRRAGVGRRSPFPCGWGGCRRTAPVAAAWPSTTCNAKRGWHCQPVLSVIVGRENCSTWNRPGSSARTPCCEERASRAGDRATGALVVPHAAPNHPADLGNAGSRIRSVLRRRDHGRRLLRLHQPTRPSSVPGTVAGLQCRPSRWPGEARYCLAGGTKLPAEFGRVRRLVVAQGRTAGSRASVPRPGRGPGWRRSACGTGPGLCDPNPAVRGSRLGLRPVPAWAAAAVSPTMAAVSGSLGLGLSRLVSRVRRPLRRGFSASANCAG
jgi:hypothetical protein